MNQGVLELAEARIKQNISGIKPDTHGSSILMTNTPNLLIQLNTRAFNPLDLLVSCVGRNVSKIGMSIHY
jgi:hypothetical protein